MSIEVSRSILRSLFKAKKADIEPATVVSEFATATYECELHRRPGNELILSLTHKTSYAFYKQPFSRSTLFVLDKASSYYCENTNDLVSAICDIVKRERFERVVMFGASKGGYGALLVSALCANLLPCVSFRAVSFSAQTEIYPENKALDFPSYKNMLKRAARDVKLRRHLEVFGKLDNRYDLPNLYWVLVYGEKNKKDVAEADRIFGQNVRKYPIPFAFHGSSIPFCVNRSDMNNVRSEVRAIYKGAASEPDLLATLPRDQEIMVKQMIQTNWLPSLVQIVEGTLDVPLSTP